MREEPDGDAGGRRHDKMTEPATLTGSNALSNCEALPLPVEQRFADATVKPSALTTLMVQHTSEVGLRS